METRHGLYLLADNGESRCHIYANISRLISQNIEVIYEIERDMVIDVIQDMRDKGIMRVDDYVASGSLKIICKSHGLHSSSLFNKKTRDGAMALLDSKRNVVVDDNNRLDGITAILVHNLSSRSQSHDEDGINAQLFSQNKKPSAITAVEGKSGKPIPTEVICCYSKNLFSKSSLKDIITILRSHQYVVIPDSWSYRKLNQHSILRMVKCGLARSLDEDTSQLLLKTLKLIYKMDEGSIVSHPEDFENTLCKVLGRATAGKVLKDIKNEINKNLECSGNNNDSKNNGLLAA